MSTTNVCPSCNSSRVVQHKDTLRCLDENIEFKLVLNVESILKKSKELCKNCQEKLYEKCKTCKTHLTVNKLIEKK